MDKNKIRNVLLLILIVGLVGMTVIYALISTNLRIESGVDMTGTTWDIHFANLSDPVIEGHASVIEAPILNRETIMNLKVRLTRPGDSVSYRFDIVNDGDINAILKDYTIANNERFNCVSEDIESSRIACENIQYTLKYTNNSYPISQMNTLNAGEIRNVTLKIEYKDVDVIPKSDVKVSGLNAYFTYIQN